MKVLNDWQEFPQELRGGVLCVGNFDGVHMGHARMLSTGRVEASARGVPFTIMTFDPHPSLLLKPKVPRPPLTTMAQRQELLASFSPDVLLVVPTSWEFLSITADDFLHNIVTGHPGSGMGATLMVEGSTFTYGRSAAGTVETLQKAGPALGFQTIVIPTQERSLTDLTLVKVSSSITRWLISHGRVADAARTLGRPYTVRGTVVEGAKRGRTIGFPTANLATTQLLPAPGVYAGHAVIGGERHRAAISIGDNPTFEGAATTLEAFILDFDGDLYGTTLDLAFQHWVREMTAFSGVAPLVTQMQHDVAWTRKIIELAEQN
jgi:riboflavin kinase/FMN adenylyltransferase